MLFNFYKYQGTGNDFIIFDNREQQIPTWSKEQIAHLCNRRMGIGADGLMLLNKLEGYDFKMMYYNADGNESTMCGNGGRCLTKFAYHSGIHRSSYRFKAIDGDHEAEIEIGGLVRLKMQDVNQVDQHASYTLLNTGSPHLVKFTTEIDEIDVVETGRTIRNSDAFAAEGVNVNFVQTLSQDSIQVRTYERGVEDETLSCGTGVTASALLCAHNDNGFNRVEVKTKGGHLSVEFNKNNDEHFTDIWLCGPAEIVFQGVVEV